MSGVPAVVAAGKMQVGSKGKGGHWTRQQVENRQAAAQKMKRKTPAKLEPPQWVNDDLAVFRIWSAIIKNAKDLDLLDNLDANALATYCKLEAEKERAVKRGDMKLFDKLAKTSLPYAKSLGLTPDGRARLAKAVAEHGKDPNADLFD